MPTVTSADGTTIAYETRGTGFAVIVIDGAMTHRDFGPARPLATALADHHTVHIYDRRGRGDSGNTPPWSEDREIEDIAAVLQQAGGQAYAAAVSSGALLAADAANRLPGLTKNAARALSEAIPKATYRTLPGQTHMVKPAVLAPAIKTFFSEQPR